MAKKIKPNKPTLLDERRMYVSMFGEEFMVEESPISKEDLNSYDEAIFLYAWFLDEAINRDDQTEAAFLRRMLQEAKVNKRRALAL